MAYNRIITWGDKISAAMKGRTYEELHGEEGAIKRKQKIVETRRRNNSYGHTMSDETKKKMSLAHKGTIFTKEHRFHIGEAQRGPKNNNYGKVRSEEHCRKISQALKGRMSPTMGKHHSVETRRKMSASISRRFLQPDLRYVLRERMKGIPSIYKGKTYVELFGEERAKQIVMKRRKTLEDNPHILKKMIFNLNMKPNNSEKKLTMLIDDLNLPYKYVGDGSFLIGTLNPDFVNEQDKKIIELFGDYWHDDVKRETYCEDGRKKYMAERGYETLVIWDSELKKDVEAVKKKLLDFQHLGDYERLADEVKRYGKI